MVSRSLVPTACGQSKLSSTLSRLVSLVPESTEIPRLQLVMMLMKFESRYLKGSLIIRSGLYISSQSLEDGSGMHGGASSR
jgi:hypothetical protein